MSDSEEPTCFHCKEEDDDLWQCWACLREYCQALVCSRSRCLECRADGGRHAARCTATDGSEEVCLRCYKREQT